MIVEVCCKCKRHEMKRLAQGSRGGAVRGKTDLEGAFRRHRHHNFDVSHDKTT